MKRGEIYYVRRRDAIGSETMKARPAIIVSHNALNNSSEVVEVVYLTTQPKKDLPTHATINSTGTTSTALCEHIDHVSTLLIGDYCGTCTAEEMRSVDVALMESLGLKNVPREGDPFADDEAKKAIDVAACEIAKLNQELRQVKTERDRYLKLLDIVTKDIEV